MALFEERWLCLIWTIYTRRWRSSELMFIVTSYCKYYYRHPQPCYLPACHVNTNANTLNKSNIASQSFILVKKKRTV